jgi:uncharacterized membrane protein YhaH (DUF805 family)
MSWGQILFSFEGRVGRKTYWMFLIVVLVLFGLIGAVAGGSAASATDPDAAAAAASKMATLMGVCSLIIIWPSLAIAVKRWHDVDKSGWWVLVGLVPAVGGLIALVFNGFIAGTPGPNQYGPPPA